MIVAPQVLDTLPAEEWHSGMAEVLKTLIIGDAEMYGEAVEWYGGILARRQAPGNEVRLGNKAQTAAVQGQWGAGMPGRMVRRCIEIKSAIVEADRTEKGERKKLNLGHTLGHAVESVCMEAGRQVAHGEAVAAGIMAAAEISWRKGMLKEEEAKAVINDFKYLGYRDVPGLLAEHADLSREELASKISDFVQNDKKRKEDFINFVVIRSIGSVSAEPMSVNEIQQTVYDLY